MRKTEKIYMLSHLSSNSKDELTELLKDWVSFVRILTDPEIFRINDGETEAFNLFRIKEAFEQLTPESNLWLKIRAAGGEFQVHISGLTIVERNIFDASIFSAYHKMVENYCDLRMEKNGTYGYIRSLDEYLYNNVERLDKRDFQSQDELEKLPKRYNYNKEIVVDCNLFSGYDIYYKGLCMTSCWKMYYSNLYFQIIPRQIFLEVQQVQTIEELQNDMVKISLYLDPFKWEAEVNQKYQCFFREQIGFDQLVWTNGVGVLRPPLIEFAFIDQAVQTVQYQNDQLQPVEKKKATYFVTRSSDYIRKEYSENRTRGILNVQAYFPWIDHEGKKMMNYRVLNPELTLDEGLSAYEFYIRQYLEIDIMDERYESYIAVLRFYLPDQFLKELPLEPLYEKLYDVTISNLNQEKEVTYFDLDKAKNHLRVAFLSNTQLEAKNLKMAVEEE
ncbi:hypothetical protein IW492_07265 [Enterococcus sp. BWB1-3]|uniref:hypothetical protein n=1 Tax=Enterococcus sp. BWB1-3 TaxID=2787713 RepID=UPI001924ACD0|nr:hypothetical protein [Enterococcus sp. BWB1-3]MBL1229032.1 hypothetical protein [Enterococcus sp. BWB1-3]